MMQARAESRRKGKPKSDMFRRGRIDGKVWSNRRASFEQLDRLAAFATRRGDSCAGLARRTDGALALPQYFGAAASGDHDACVQFWREIAGPEWQHLIKDPEFVQGFVEAVIEVYTRYVGELGHS